jgi:Ca2+:H+ antiporter
LVFVIEFVTSGGRIRTRISGEMAYAHTIAGLGWYLGWPFGKYVEGKGVFTRPHDDEDGSEEGVQETDSDRTQNQQMESSSDMQGQVQGLTRISEPSCNRSKSEDAILPKVSASITEAALSPTSERQQLLPKPSRPEHAQAHGVTFGGANNGQARESLYGAIHTTGGKAPEGSFRQKRGTMLSRLIGGAAYWIAFCGVIAPVLGIICLLCWGGVITIPMAKLTWKLLKLMALRPLEIKFRSAPKVIEVVNTAGSSSSGNAQSAENLSNGNAASSESANGHSVMRPARLKAGQLAPTAGPDSTVLLCTYRAIGFGLYKYTVGGVNIIFVNLLPLVFFTIFDGLVLLPAVERAEHRGERINPILTFLASQALIFILSLASVIPLSYFIGMAVASISAQSSIGMGAVINATFGSIIEIILYGIALTQGKGKLVEGSIVGSILAGVLLMPGLSMVSGAFKRKEQRFNAKSAGVTSTMLIMAIIGTLTPTLFYQTYGSVSSLRDFNVEIRSDSPIVLVRTQMRWMPRQSSDRSPRGIFF